MRPIHGILITLAIVFACTTGNKTINTMTGAFATCARADLGKIVTGPNGPATLLSAVAAIISLNLPTLEADLAALVTPVGIDGVQCAIAAIEAVLGTQPSTATTMTAIAKTPLPGLVRALAWSKAQTATSAK